MCSPAQLLPPACANQCALASSSILNPHNNPVRWTSLKETVTSPNSPVPVPSSGYETNPNRPLNWRSSPDLTPSRSKMERALSYLSGCLSRVKSTPGEISALPESPWQGRLPVGCSWTLSRLWSGRKQNKSIPSPQFAKQKPRGLAGAC